MELGFSGEVVDFYQRYRRGYPTTVIDALVDACGLRTDDIVLDIGCGTGQLTLPMADRVRVAVGVDPEPEMLERARSVAAERGTANVTWMLAADTDLAVLVTLLGERAVGAVTIGQALHWMDHDALWRTVAPLIRPGGAVAVVNNGVPSWLHDTPWSRALRGCLERWLDTSLTQTCGTDDASRHRYADSLTAAGFDVSDISVGYTDEIDLDQLVGGVYSAFSAAQLPTPQQRPVFAEQIRRALHPQDRFAEAVRVGMVIGRVQ